MLIFMFSFDLFRSLFIPALFLFSIIAIHLLLIILYSFLFLIFIETSQSKGDTTNADCGMCDAF